MTSTPPTNTPPTASPKTPGSIGSEKNCFSFALQQQPRTPLSAGADSLLPPGEKRTYSGTSFHRAPSAGNSSSNNSSMNSGNNAVNPFVPSMNTNNINGGGSTSSNNSSIHSIQAANSTTSGTSTGIGSMNSNTFGSAINNNNNIQNMTGGNTSNSNPSTSSSNERGSSQLFGNLTAITNPSLQSGNNGGSGNQQQQLQAGGARTSNQSNRTDNDTYGSANSIQHLELGSGGSVTTASQSANRSPTPSAFGACLSAGRSPADRGMSLYSLQNNASRPHEFDTRPVITVKALARFVYDSWLNGPFKKLYFPDLYKRNVPLEGKNISKQSLKILFQNSCWLSYVLHHSIVQAVCQGYNVHVDKNNRVVKCWVFDGEKVNLGEVPHSWNVFQTESILLSAEEAHVLHLNEQQNNGRRTHSRNFSAGSAGASAASRYLELEEESARTNSIFCCDLTIDQFDDNQKVPETINVPAYKVVKGPARLRADVFKTATESKHWIGKEVLLDHHHEKDLFARQDLWQYFVMLLLAYSARNFPFADTFFTPPPGALQPPEQVPSGVSSRHHRRASSNSAYSPSLTPNTIGAHGNDIWPLSGRSTPGDTGDLLSANGNNRNNNRRGSFHRSPLATSALLPPKEEEQRENVEAKMEDAFKFYMKQLQMQQMYEMIKSSDAKYLEHHHDNSLCSTQRSTDLQEQPPQQRRVLPRVFGNSQKSDSSSNSKLDISPNASTTPTLRPSGNNNSTTQQQQLGNFNISAPSRAKVSVTNNTTTPLSNPTSSKSTSSNGSDLMPAPSTNSQQHQAPPSVLAQMQHQQQHQPKSHMLPQNNIHHRGGGGAMQQLHQQQVHATSQFVQQQHQQHPMMPQQLIMQQHPPTQLVMAQTHSATMVPQSNPHANLLMATAAGQHQLAQQQHHPLVGPHPQHPHPQQPQQVLHSNPNAGLTQMTMMMPQQVVQQQQQMLPQLLVNSQLQQLGTPNMLMAPQLQMQHQQQQQQMLLQQQQQQQQQQHLMQMQLQQQQLQQQQQHQAAVAQQSQMLAMSSSGGAIPNPLMSTLPPQQQLTQAMVPAPMTQMHLQQPMQTQMLAMTAPITPLQQQQQAVAAQQLLLQQQQQLLQMQQQRLAELQKQQQQVIASQQLAMAQQQQQAQLAQAQQQQQQQQLLAASASSSSSGSFNTVASPGSALSGTTSTTAAAGLGQSNNSASISSSTSSNQKINNNNNSDADAINKMANFEIPEPPFELASSPKYQKDIMQIQREVQHFIRACILCGGDEALRRKQVLFSFMLTRFLHTKELLQVQTDTDTPRNKESV